MALSNKRGQVTFQAVGAIKNKKSIGALEWLERFAYRKADRIVAVTNAFKLHIVAHGGSKVKTTVIRNGVDLGFFADSMGVKDKFVAAYVGTHGMAHGLDVILDAAEMLRKREGIVFLTAGDGAERKLSRHKN